MNCDTIKYKAVLNQNKNVELQIYRNFGTDEKDSWVMMDRFNELTPIELKCLADYIYSILKPKGK